jgi:hypothetical protein
MRGISWLADDLLASQEGLCSMYRYVPTGDRNSTALCHGQSLYWLVPTASTEERILLILTEKNFRRGRETVSGLRDRMFFVRAVARSEGQTCDTPARLFTTRATLTSEHKINKGHFRPPLSRLHKTHSFVEGCPWVPRLMQVLSGHGCYGD